MAGPGERERESSIGLREEQADETTLIDSFGGVEPMRVGAKYDGFILPYISIDIHPHRLRGRASFFSPKSGPSY